MGVATLRTKVGPVVGIVIGAFVAFVGAPLLFMRRHNPRDQFISGLNRPWVGNIGRPRSPEGMAWRAAIGFVLGIALIAYSVAQLS